MASPTKQKPDGFLKRLWGLIGSAQWGTIANVVSVLIASAALFYSVNQQSLSIERENAADRPIIAINTWGMEDTLVQQSLITAILFKIKNFGKRAAISPSFETRVVVVDSVNNTSLLYSKRYEVVNTFVPEKSVDYSAAQFQMKKTGQYHIKIKFCYQDIVTQQEYSDSSYYTISFQLALPNRKRIVECVWVDVVKVEDWLRNNSMAMPIFNGLQ